MTDPALQADTGEPRLHRHPLAERSVFSAPGRARRPSDLEPADADAFGPGGAGPVPTCPFCAGNEALTPPAVLTAPDRAGSPWRCRIIPNQYPVVGHAPRGPAAEPVAAEPDGVDRPAHGVHEVVVESPRHERSILALEPAAWAEVWDLARRRLARLAERDDLAWYTVFKNSGPRAGASLAHVHSQIVGLDFVPQLVAAEVAAAARASDPFGALVREAGAAGRVVDTEGDLVLLVPPAPRQPFEAWILPHSAEPRFAATSPANVRSLALLTQSFVARLARLDLPGDYNWWLHDLPRAAPTVADRWHWHLEIVPRLQPLAGLELGTGCHITTLRPAESARRLREA